MNIKGSIGIMVLIVMSGASVYAADPGERVSAEGAIIPQSNLSSNAGEIDRLKAVHALAQGSAPSRGIDYVGPGYGDTIPFHEEIPMPPLPPTSVAVGGLVPRVPISLPPSDPDDAPSGAVAGVTEDDLISIGIVTDDDGVPFPSLGGGGPDDIYDPDAELIEEVVLPLGDGTVLPSSISINEEGRPPRVIIETTLPLDDGTFLPPTVSIDGDSWASDVIDPADIKN